MESFLNLFFFIDKLPSWVGELGKSWGIDMACACSLPIFVSIILHLIAGWIIIAAILDGRLARGVSAFTLIGGLFLSVASRTIDLAMNLISSTQSAVTFDYNLDLLVEGLQFLGLGLIFYTIFKWNLRNL